ncbi:hypothetical protein CIW49_16420 [Mycolicibacterium sp. P1-18]|uniref:endonuclease domain-containing protein n=1 Tax=Mycolicibacterium sp. P1-18 TaxID=2024615 RepID=UPI0011F19C64|nr:hypothetical protein [Mycolicibacterium sp. P1-18]KAA0097467.1 hypothetical protein CIW49_16420 [Mycolicibacterium sp. P1-18]
MADLDWPFVGAEALADRLVPERAMRMLYEPLYAGVYVPWGIEPSAVERAKAAWLWSRRRAVVAGSSAAAMLGAKWVDGARPAELIHDNRKPPQNVVVHSDVLGRGETQDCDGIPVTTAARTAFDLGRRIANRITAVQRLDALTAATHVAVSDVEAVMNAHPGARGLPRLRTVLPLVDGGAESPQETVARLALVDAGLPRPATQVEVFGRYGEFLARLDMAYEDAKVGIEYDGPQHWTDPAVRQRDIDKQFELTTMGWVIIRASRDMMRYRRRDFVSRVESALRERGVEPSPSVKPATRRRRVAS